MVDNLETSADEENLLTSFPHNFAEIVSRVCTGNLYRDFDKREGKVCFRFASGLVILPRDY